MKEDEGWKFKGIQLEKILIITLSWPGIKCIRKYP